MNDIVLEMCELCCKQHNNTKLLENCFQANNVSLLSGVTSLGSTTFTTEEWTDVSKGWQREFALVQYYQDLIQRQMLDYQRVRFEEEQYEQELTQINEYTRTLDQILERAQSEAQKFANKDAFFRRTYNKLMDDQEPQVKETSKYLKGIVSIRDELYKTLKVTSQTEKQAIENATGLEINYRRRLKDLLQTRIRLQQRLRTFRQCFEQTQQQKKAAYDEMLAQLEEIDQIESEQRLAHLKNLTIK